jgi:hypothetical protein
MAAVSAIMWMMSSAELKKTKQRKANNGLDGGMAIIQDSYLKRVA